MSKISVFLADWQVLFREGIHFTLSGEEDFEVIGESTNNEDALAFIESNTPQVAVLNINHDGKLSGVEATCRIKRNFPSVSVILIMDSDDEELLFSAMESAANGCLTKDADPDDLINLIRKVAEGSYPISQALLRPGIASHAVSEFEASSAIGEPLANLLAHLTPLEADILHQIIDVNPKQQVCQALGITDQEIDQHFESIRTKIAANEHRRELIEAAQASLATIPQLRMAGKPSVEYVTKEEFIAFKESLRERFKSLTGELV